MKFFDIWYLIYMYIQKLVAICCIANTITLSNTYVRFIALNIGTPDRFRKGDSLSSSSCHAVLQPFDLLNRRMFVQSIQQNFSVSCRNFDGIPLCVLEISPFFAIVHV